MHKVKNKRQSWVQRAKLFLTEEKPSSSEDLLMVGRRYIIIYAVGQGQYGRGVMAICSTFLQLS